MLTKELDIAQKLSKEAARMILDFYDRGFEVEFKEKNNPVTQADKAANEFITSELEKSFPNDAILAEELKDDFQRLQKRRVWLVDPLDGTKEFISKNGEFCVMIWLVEECRPILGVVYQPTRIYCIQPSKIKELLSSEMVTALHWLFPKSQKYPNCVWS